MNCDIAKHFYVPFFLKEGDKLCSYIIKTGDHEANTSQSVQFFCLFVFNPPSVTISDNAFGYFT